MTKGRSAKFIGSAMWRKRDVRIETYTPACPGAESKSRVTDLLSGIVIWGHQGQSVESLVEDLAHRVRQLTT